MPYVPVPPPPSALRHESSACGTTLLFLIIAVAVIVQILRSVRRAQEAKFSAMTAEALDARSEQRRRRSDFTQALGLVKTRDPSFDRDAFLAQAERIFVETQNAWSTGDFTTARRFLSDGVLRRFTVQIGINEHFGKRNVVADVRVQDKEIVHVEADDSFDTIHVELAASLRDCDVPRGTPNEQAFGKASRAQVTRFKEVWSFVRRLNPSPSKGRLSEGTCPACGAPVQKTVTATCDYCQAVLNSGSYDWVLSEITQSEEFAPDPRAEVGGYAALKAADPAVNRQVLEDRACLVFWKRVEGLATEDGRRFARYAVAEAHAALFPSHPVVERKGRETRGGALAQTAVGAIELFAVEPEDGEVGAKAHFLVKWSTTGAGTGLVYSSVLTLARGKGVRTNEKLGMSTERCHRCAAPQTVFDALTCGHCDALLREEWAFAALVDRDFFQAKRKAESASGIPAGVSIIEDPWERRRAMGAMVAMARADGDVSEKERRLLSLCAKRWALGSDVVEGLLHMPLQELSAVKPGSQEESRMLYQAVAAAAYVDGEADRAEQQLLDFMAGHLGLAAEEVQAALLAARQAPVG
jgi:tellurite resistance protein